MNFDEEAQEAKAKYAVIAYERLAKAIPGLSWKDVQFDVAPFREVSLYDGSTRGLSSGGDTLLAMTLRVYPGTSREIEQRGEVSLVHGDMLDWTFNAVLDTVLRKLRVGRGLACLPATTRWVTSEDVAT